LFLAGVLVNQQNFELGLRTERRNISPGHPTTLPGLATVRFDGRNVFLADREIISYLALR
jgi:hypothetical protein